MKKIKLLPKIGSFVLTVCMMFSTLPVFANNKTAEFIIKKVEDAPDTLQGDAKVKLSVKGAQGRVTIVQTAIEFEGDFKFTGVEFYKGETNPINKSYQTAVQNGNKIMISIVANNGMEFENTEDLLTVNFHGEPGDILKVKISDLKYSYCTVDGEDLHPTEAKECNVTANTEAVEGIEAVVHLKMNKLVGFSYKNESGITITISRDKTDEQNTASVISTILKKEHRDTASRTPAFKVKTTVSANATYTVEGSGIGYVTYKKSGIKFKKDEPVEIDNSLFVPGDVNNDSKVDTADKEMLQDFISKGEYSMAADFNRDMLLNEDDLAIFNNIKEETAEEGSNKPGESESEGGSNSGEGSGSGGGGGGGFGTGAAPVVPATPTTPANSEMFTDLANYTWAKDAIYMLKDKGIIRGISETEFAPANNIKRGDFMLILTRMLGINGEFSENFADVPQNSYYYNAVGCAKAAGIATGDGANFMPENSITRQDLIILSHRAFVAKGYISETDDLSVLDAFTDKDDIAEYAQKAMAAMVKAGIIKGSEGKVNPKGFATRAEVAVMCVRLAELIK